MPSLRRNLSSMSALTTFEAAARLSSFTQAAGELGVTQAAVSRQIKQLESELNTVLFRRAHRRVTLTAAGAALAGTVTSAFDSMAEMIETIRTPDSGDTVTVGATLAFSHFWILPRLPQLRADHPKIKLRLVSDDSATDLRRDRLDVAIRFGRPPFADGRSIASQPDEVYPVCSPKLLAAAGMAAVEADILRLPLIASDTVNPSWLTWRSWAQAVGLGRGPGIASDRSALRFSHYSETIQAAVDGEGVALGWSMLLSAHLQEGRLVRIGRDSLQLEDRYHVIVPNTGQPSASARIFVDWIGAQFAEMARPR